LSRGNQMTRQWKMLQYLLTHRRGAAVQELTALLACQRRTLYRDLEALQEAGFPLLNQRDDTGTVRWKLMDTYTGRLPIPFDIAELAALYFSRDLLKALQGSFFADALDSMFAKIRTTLPDKLADYLEKMAGQVKIGALPGRHLKDVSAIMDRINRAVGENRRLKMQYKALKRTTAAWRRVDPYALWFANGTFYLIAYCHQRQAVRIFALDRILGLETIQENFASPQDFDVDEYMQGSFGVFRGKPRRVEIWFAPAVAPLITDTLWHDSQSIREQDDGSIILGLRVAVNPELERWVMGWGAQARAIRPPELAQAIKQQGAAMLAAYWKDKQDPLSPSGGG